MVLLVKTGVVMVAEVQAHTGLWLTSNHWYGPPGPVAVKVAVFPLQTVTGGAVGPAGVGKTVTVTGVGVLGQPATVATTV